jgi:proton-dependent oligopeptide transporter, POT family
MSSYSRVRLSSTGGEDNDAESASSEPPQAGVCRGLYLHFQKSFQSLSTCPRELYINFFLKFCESYGYFSISQILVIYLHTEFNASDVTAGAIYGVWGACITFWGLTISWLNDNFGVRNSLLLGFTISLISSIILATAKSLPVIYFVLFMFMPMGTAMGIPMLTVGIKRYTNTTNRGFAFGLYYSVMNVAAFVSGPVVDFFNIGFKNGALYDNNKVLMCIHCL